MPMHLLHQVFSFIFLLECCYTPKCWVLGEHGCSSDDSAGFKGEWEHHELLVDSRCYLSCAENSRVLVIA